jgi:hypothetical protein
MTSKSDTVAWL